MIRHGQTRVGRTGPESSDRANAVQPGDQPSGRRCGTDDDSTPTVTTSAVTVTLATDSAQVADTDGFPSGTGTMVVPIVSRGLLILANVNK